MRAGIEILRISSLLRLALVALLLLPVCSIKDFPDDPAVQRFLESALLCADCEVPAGVPGVVLTPTGGTVDVAESGLVDSYTIELNTEPAAVVNVSLSFDGTQITINGSSTSPQSILLDNVCPGPNCWSSPQTISVAAVDDGIPESNPHTEIIAHSATSTDTDYSGISIASIPVSITDNDTPGFTIVESGGSSAATEGASDSYTVALTTAPASPVTINISA
ncbi:MAG: hypothetical protein KDK23_11410, partial [Leptospiraceae bacterium]|nr:hypothetical protein [Leptospiraceae bacterium]